MSAISLFVFLLIYTTVCAFIPPFNDYQDKIHEIKKLQGNMGNKHNIHLNTTDFKSLKEQNVPLVDKTNFITDFMNDTNDHVIITRPRGFGKSFSHSMLYHFFNIHGNSTDLFKGTSVAKNQDFCRAHQNQYPVIRVSFAELKNAKTWEEAEFLFKVAFSRILEDHTNSMGNQPKTDQATGSKSQESPDPLLIIQDLSRYLYGQLKKKAIVLIDEYDAPIFAAYYNGYDSKMMGFLRSLYPAALNDNPFVHKSLILGVSRVGKKEIFSGINHLEIYTVMESRYSSYFGFDKTETAQLIQDYKLRTGLIEKMVQKYGGYRFGDHSLLNPYSLAQSLVNGGNLMNYWMDSERDFAKLINSSGVVPRFESELLLMKISINHTYDDGFSYLAVKNDLNAFWTLVTDFGYVTVTEKKQEVLGRFKCKLAIPNEEVSMGFGSFVNEYHTQHKNILTYTDWTKMLLSQNPSGSVAALKSYFDSALQYLSTEKISDPLTQIEILFRTLFEGQRKYYEQVEFDTKQNMLYAELKGGQIGIPLRIRVLYSKLGKEQFFLIPVIKSSVQYRRLFTHMQFGSAVINDKYLMYMIENSRGNFLKQFFDCIDRWVGRPVEDFDTKLRTCLKRWWS